MLIGLCLAGCGERARRCHAGAARRGSRPAARRSRRPSSSPPPVWCSWARMLPGPTARLGRRPVLSSPARMRVERYLKGHGPRTVRVDTAVTIEPRRHAVGEDGIAPRAGERWKIYTDLPPPAVQHLDLFAGARASRPVRLPRRAAARRSRCGEGSRYMPIPGRSSRSARASCSIPRVAFGPTPRRSRTLEGHFVLQHAVARLGGQFRSIRRGPGHRCLPPVARRPPADRRQGATADHHGGAHRHGAVPDRPRADAAARVAVSFQGGGRSGVGARRGAARPLHPAAAAPVRATGLGQLDRGAATVSPSGTAIKLSFSGAPPGTAPCDANYRASARGRPSGGRLHDHDARRTRPAGSGLHRPRLARTAVLHLARPLGARVLVSATDGGAVAVTRAVAGGSRRAHRRGVDDRGRGLAVEQEPVEDRRELLDRAEVELDVEAVLAGDAQALLDLRGSRRRARRSS